MAADYELTIVITAVDDASATLASISANLIGDFAAIEKNAASFAAEVDQDLESIAPITASIAGDVDGLSQSLTGVTQSVSALSAAISVLGGEAVSLGSVESALSSFDTSLSQGSGLAGGFGVDSGNQLSSLVDLSQQQLALFSELASPSGALAPQQFVQNNTFNGILDPTSIVNQVLPELERLFARGTTLFNSF